MARDRKKFETVVLLILTLGLFLRLYKINLPLLEFYPSRQVQTAEITRNFFRGGINILSPTVHYLGPGSGTFLVEFPLYNSVVASIYKLTGGVDEVWGRLFSIFGWLISCYFLFKIAQRFIGNFGSRVALFFYTFSPLSILVSRSFQPDQWMLTLSLGAIYLLNEWARKKSRSFFFLSVAVASLSILLKIPSVIFTLIPAFVLLKLTKPGTFRKNALIYSPIAILPATVWYLYVALVNRAGNVLEGSTRLANWFGLELYLNPRYWSNMFGFEMNLVLLPVGMVLFLVGALTKLKKDQQFLYFWLGSVVLYFFIFNKHNMTHEYYHLPFLPIAAIFIGVGAGRVFKAFDNLIFSKKFLLLIFSTLIFLMMLPSTLARAYKPIERFSYVIETANAVKTLTKPDDLIIGSMDAGPTLVYYANRHGWTFEVNRENTTQSFAFYGVRDKKILDAISDLEDKRAEGAVIFASSYKPQFLENQEFANHMYSNYLLLEETENYIIFDLDSPLLER